MGDEIFDRYVRRVFGYYEAFIYSFCTQDLYMNQIL